MLDKERQYYAGHVEEWTKAHPHKFVLIKGEDVVGFYDTIDDALSAGGARYGLTSFLVREVGSDPRTVTVPALTLGLLRADP